MTKELDLHSLDFAEFIRRGDTVMWGQATAEPVPLTQALMAQRRAIGQFNVFLGMTHSDTPKPEHADCIAFSSYCGTGGNRTLVKAGKLDILPCHYSQLPGLIQSGGLKIEASPEAAVTSVVALPAPSFSFSRRRVLWISICRSPRFR